MSDLRTWLGIFKLGDTAVNKVNLENRIQDPKTTWLFAQRQQGAIITHFSICIATHAQVLFTNTVYEIWHKKLLQLKCVLHMLHWKPVKTTWTIALLPTVMWNGKISSPRGLLLVSQHLWMGAQTAKVKQSPSARSKTSYICNICRWTCTPKRHPEPWYVVQRCTSAMCSPAHCWPCWPG